MSTLFGGSGSSDMKTRKDQMKQQISQELAVANAQMLLNKINENCFAKCVTRPSTSLSSSEEVSFHFVSCFHRRMNRLISPLLPNEVQSNPRYMMLWNGKGVIYEVKSSGYVKNRAHL
ncbi:mitochondrial import inner membrane translocase subunit TIM13 [Tremella mesenterica]|uniref:Mitochondrial import inner membrane translocase subunit n=1 Tax=Tremella mesenterica TaxID=5217 RepID=A0A4Q1BGA7_TREME|nr:mitochondrial import inner membrane translocase subunit TIM13 [Tremella mesenterica]